MTLQQLAEFRDLLAKGKVADDRQSDERVFLRGWTAGVDFAERMLCRVLGEKEGPPK
jgi:hypothetical protein